MDVLVTSRKKIYRRIDTGVAMMLIDAFPEIFKPANPEPASLAGVNGNVQAPRPAAASEWGLATSRFDRGEIVGLTIMLAGGEVLNVSGPAKGMKERCERALAGRRAPLPSDALIEAYARATEAVNR